MFKVEQYKTLEQFQQALNTLQSDWLKDSWIFDSWSGSIIAVYVKQDIKEPAVAKDHPLAKVLRMPILTSPFREVAEKSAQDWNNVAAFTPKPQEETVWGGNPKEATA